MISMQRTPIIGSLYISRLKSRYPIWAVRVQDSGALLREVGSAVLAIDLSTGAGKVDGGDVLGEIRRRIGGARVGGACYQLSQLAHISDRYGPGWSMPEPEERFVKRLESIGATEEDVVILLTADTSEDELEHELTHALFYSEPEFRSGVERIWESLSSRKRERIRKSLGEFYGLNAREMLLQEFAAYAAIEREYGKKVWRAVLKEREAFLPPDSAP